MKLEVVVLMVLLQFPEYQTQQTYVNNKQLDCENNHTTALGYVCSSSSRNTHCSSYLTFRSNPKYNSAATIAYLLGAVPTEIARANNITDIDVIPTETLVIVPVNCSCSASGGGYYYQHNTSFFIKSPPDTYFSVANNTYQGLTTCQSLIAQNPYNYNHLLAGMELTIPLRCACPSPNQTASGLTYLLTYLVYWGDSIESIAQAFAADSHTIFQANLLTPGSLIFPFTPILVPLQSPPTYNPVPSSPSSSAPSAPLALQSPPTYNPVPSSLSSSAPSVPLADDNNSTPQPRKWIFIGVGIGIGSALLLFSLAGLFLWFFFLRRCPSPKADEKWTPSKKLASNIEEELENKPCSVSSQGVRYAIGWMTIYTIEELHQATGYFAEANRIKGSVYRGHFKGDDAAVKIMMGDVSGEINLLKQINHSNIIRLSGFCVYQHNTYLVYEYAECGSLGDCLMKHHNSKKILPSDTCSNLQTTTLTWKQRVQIAYDVADALNYLHNYSNPPYIHKNLKSSNILLDGNLRAKISNLGLARTVEPQQTSNDNQGQGLLQLTRHVNGTRGYMAPEYIEKGLITPKLDVFAFGVVMLELLSGREAAPLHKPIDGDANDTDNVNESLLYNSINDILGGEDVREKLRGFVDPSLRGNEYPLDLVYSMAELAKSCVAHDLNSRPTMADVCWALNWSRAHRLWTGSTSNGNVPHLNTLGVEFHFKRSPY